MPAIIIHTLDHAVAALEAFREFATNGFVLSPLRAGATLGAAVFKAMIDEAQSRVPEAGFTAVLDCGEDPGHALAAIRSGVKAIVFTGTAEALARITDIARKNNAQMIESSVYTDPMPLDLLDQKMPHAACEGFLKAFKYAKLGNGE